MSRPARRNRDPALCRPRTQGAGLAITVGTAESTVEFPEQPLQRLALLVPLEKTPHSCARIRRAPRRSGRHEDLWLLASFGLFGLWDSSLFRFSGDFHIVHQVGIASTSAFGTLSGGGFLPRGQMARGACPGFRVCPLPCWPARGFDPGGAHPSRTSATLSL